MGSKAFGQIPGSSNGGISGGGWKSEWGAGEQFWGTASFGEQLSAPFAARAALAPRAKI